MDKYLIDELCRLSGFSRRTVRYYVQSGLVDPPAGRGRGGFYDDSHLRRLERIRELQEQGYRLEAIRRMLAPNAEAPAAPAPASAPAPVPAPAPAAAPASGPAPAARREPDLSRSTWTRIALAPGVELHLTHEAEARLGPAIGTAIEALRAVAMAHGSAEHGAGPTADPVDPTPEDRPQGGTDA